MERLGEAALASLLGSPSSPGRSMASGPSSVFQCQAGDLLRRGALELLSSPVEVLTLEFACPEELREEYEVTTGVTMTAAGPVDGVLMWWSLDMTPSGSVQLSTSPLDPGAQDRPPRYHWQQGACVFPSPLNLSIGDGFNLRTLVRGGWDLFFEALAVSESTATANAGDEFAFPAIPRPRLLQLADEGRIHFYRAEIEAALKPDKSRPRSLALCLGDGWVGLVAALAVCDEVIACPFSEEAAASMQRILTLRGDDGRSRVVVHSEGIAAAAVESLRGAAPDVVVCEPFHTGYATAGTSWGMEEVTLLRSALSELLALGMPGTPPVAPCVTVVARIFDLPEYYRRRQPVGSVEGFDLTPFNEAAPLWRQFDVKRQTMAGWTPTWRSGRMECAIDWLGHGGAPGAGTLATCSGMTVGEGEVHGAIIWLEDGGQELEPTDLPLTGCLTLRQAEEVTPSAGRVCVSLTGTLPDDLKCSVAFQMAA